MRDDLLKNIAEIVVSTAREEDAILRNVGKGIFYMPELAFSYAVGKKIFINAEQVFGSKRVEWEANKKISDNSGLTDLVIICNGNKFAIEFKIGGCGDNYKKDIKKLKNVPEEYAKLFCALIDTWPDSINKDNRIKSVEAETKITQIRKDKFFDFFSTLSNYKKQLCCVVGVWEVK